MKRKNTTMKEIAYELGISINTVSRAFRDCDDISDSTKEKVRKKALELGYIPTSINQFVKREGKKTIAIVYNSNKNLYYNMINQNLADVISKEGHDVTMLFVNTQGMLTEEHIKQCISERIDSIITAIEPDPTAVQIAKMHDIPIVFMEEYNGQLPLNTVCVNNKRAGSIAAKYLLNYHKAQKFVYVASTDSYQSQRRQEGFVDELKATLENPDILVLDNNNLDKQNIIQYIYDGYLNFFCFNDETAYRLIDALEKSIPNIKRVFPHLHVLGVDALSTYIVGLKDLTSISFDYYQLAVEAFNTLKDVWDKKVGEKSIKMIEPSLHQRLS